MVIFTFKIVETFEFLFIYSGSKGCGMSTMPNDIAVFLLQAKGIDLFKYEDFFLDKSIHDRIVETQCGSREAYFTILKQNQEEGQHFVDSLRISYSEFFRNPITYGFLERIILPALFLKKQNIHGKEIRVWCAACAAGQEAYSLAILMKEFNIVNKGKFRYRIFASDQDGFQVMQAQKGRYTSGALNNMNLKRLTQWFDKNRESYTVKQELKENIDFSVLDLFNEQLSCPPASIFGDFDLVICANLLFYYKNAYKSQILEKIGKCMSKSSYLVTGETERDILFRNQFREVFPQSAIFQQ